MQDGEALKKTLGPFMLWGLGTGYVISGEYFGWNLGLPKGGAGGMLCALFLVGVMYVGIALAYAELACRFPHAGGAFVYARAAFGPKLAAVSGLAQSIEFVFAPPAIALAIGAYVAQRYPGLAPSLPAAFAYVLFTLLNTWGVKQAALFELLVTLLAVAELLLFCGLTLPQVDATLLVLDPFPEGATGVLTCLPFAIWFFLGIEGLANAAEEARNPSRDLPRAFLASLATLLVLAVLVFFGAVGVAGPRGVVFAPGSDTPSDAPLPLALAHVVPANSWLFSLLLGIGVLGLVASFHGILLAAGRATMELGRAGHGPRILGSVHRASGTPRVALLANMAVGIATLFTGKTDDVISLAVMGALLAYIFSLAALLQVRRKDAAPTGLFRAPLHPWLTLLALALAGLCLLAVGGLYPRGGLAFVGILALGLAAPRRPVPATA
jgi:ethanolamine permease